MIPAPLQERHLNRIREKILEHPQLQVVLVEEVGLLVEIYGLCDFAFVGGGYGKGIHSVIEPAAQGLRVASGPNRVFDFPETRELLRIGVFSVVLSSIQISEWVRGLPRKDPECKILSRKRNGYRALLDECILIR